jgi:hypothetical protein
MIDQYFKLERVREEIQRLNIEIPRVITYIRDEAIFLQLKEVELRETNPGITYQVYKHQWERARFNDQHMHQFRKLASLPGFTGSIKPGVSIESRGVIETPMEVDTLPAGGADDGDEEEEEDDDQEDADIRDMVATLMLLTVDSPHIEIAE